MGDGVMEDGQVGRLAVLVLALGAFFGFLTVWPPGQAGDFGITTFLPSAAVFFFGLVVWIYVGGMGAALLVALGGALAFFWYGHLPLGFLLAGLEITVLWLLLHAGRPQVVPLPLAFLAFGTLFVSVAHLATWSGAGLTLPDELFFRPALDTVLLCFLMVVIRRVRHQSWSRWLGLDQRRFGLLLLLTLLPLSALGIALLPDAARVGMTGGGVSEPIWPAAVMMLPLLWGLLAWLSWRSFWLSDAAMSIGDMAGRDHTGTGEAVAATATNQPSWRDVHGLLNGRHGSSAFFAIARRRGVEGEWSVESDVDHADDVENREAGFTAPGNRADMDVHPADESEWHRLLESAASGEEASAHIRLNLSGRGWRWFYVLALPLGGGAEVLLIHLDITSVKEAERQLVQSSKMSVLGEMAAGVAHEINQPLNVIRLATQNLRRRISGESVDLEYYVGKLDRIAAQTRRAADIIDHMRIFGRKPADNPDYFSPARSVGRVIELLQSQLDADGIRTVLDCQPAGEMCWGHESLFEQVMMNLLVNARDAINAHSEGDDNREIFVLCSVTGGNALEIRVRDTGGGVPDAVLDRLFQPFFTTKPAGQGTGLGLSLSYGIIQDMNGDISVRNVAGGAEFTVRMPLSEVTVESAGRGGE